MTAHRDALLALLADGRLHTGPALAARIGVSRAAVWKIVAELRDAGIEVESLPRRGYRLPRECELLDAAAIQRTAQAAGAPPLDLEVHASIDSTNRHLYDAPAPPVGTPRVAFAELQYAGRGRRGRAWLAPFGSGLTFSIAWTYADLPAQLPALGLAIGVAVVETLRAQGARDAMLKWPNDVVWQGRKLGGLLIQLKLEAGGAASVVVGIGLNLALPDAARAGLASPGATTPGDLAEACGGRAPPRNALAGALVAAACEALERFGREGYGPWASRWHALDALAGRDVRVVQSSGSVEGRALGADTDGALRVEVAGRVERFHSGDVSLRPAEAP
ncbi:MAG: biotin--[acetyl-CoA-carboxylase] ligase [Steroidobacteraceae bacterium]